MLRQFIFKVNCLTNYSKKYFKVLNEVVDSILVLTNFHKQYLEKLDVDSKKIFVQPNYLEPKIVDNNSCKSILFMREE